MNAVKPTEIFDFSHAIEEEIVFESYVFSELIPFNNEIKRDVLYTHPNIVSRYSGVPVKFRFGGIENDETGKPGVVLDVQRISENCTLYSAYTIIALFHYVANMPKPLSYDVNGFDMEVIRNAIDSIYGEQVD